MECPVCLNCELGQETLKNGLKIDRCPSCHGTWLDRGEILRLTTNRRAALNHVAQLAWGNDEADRDCPRCRKTMVQGHFDGSKVDLDYCTNCEGLWLDSSELRKTVRFLDSNQTEAEKPASRGNDATRQSAYDKKLIIATCILVGIVVCAMIADTTIRLVLAAVDLESLRRGSLIVLTATIVIGVPLSPLVLLQVHYRRQIVREIESYGGTVKSITRIDSPRLGILWAYFLGILGAYFRVRYTDRDGTPRHGYCWMNLLGSKWGD